MVEHNSDYNGANEVGMEAWRSAREKIIVLLDEMIEQTAEIDKRIQKLMGKMSQ